MCLQTLTKLFFYLQNSNVENLPPQVLRLVYKEVSDLAADPPEGIKIYPSDEDITELHTAIEGPGTVSSGYFLLWLDEDDDNWLIYNLVYSRFDSLAQNYMSWYAIQKCLITCN